MRLDDALKRAVQERNLRMIVKVVDLLRFKSGLTYAQTFAFVNQVTGIDEAAWEGLLYEADNEVF
jgi:hypothetical protein